MHGSEEGTQVVARVSAILRSVSSRMPEGASTAVVAQDSGIPRPTVHRLLGSLATHGLVDRANETGSWLLGPELYLMGASAAARFDITQLARDIVRLLARETGESAFLSVRRGDETVCLMREEGSFPLRSFVAYEGVRFPLGVASAGLAILSYLPEQDIQSYLNRSSLTERFGPEHGAERIRARIAETRRAGYATNPALIVEGSWGMGAAVFNSSGEPEWALSVTGVESRFGDQRRRRIGRLLLDQAHVLARRIAER